MEKENKERMREVRSAENRIAQREESLDRRVESLDAREPVSYTHLDVYKRQTHG